MGGSSEPATSETFQVSPEGEGGERSRKCFSNLSPVTRCLHGVIRRHLGFALKGGGHRISVQAMGVKGEN